MRLTFKVGEKAMKNLRLVEKHFFKGEVVSTHDFATGFCMPNTENEMEVIYDLPKLDEDKKDDIITSPGETTSDTYIFVENKLIQHQRCKYSYM